MQRRYRLRRNKDFQHLRHQGRVYRHPLMLLSLLPNGLSHNRYGFITPKHLGSAVTRNRLRRLLREAVRQLHPQLDSGFDIVILTRPEAAQQPFTTLQGTVQTLCQRSGLIVKGM